MNDVFFLFFIYNNNKRKDCNILCIGNEHIETYHVLYLQYKRLLIDSKCVEQSELILTSEVLHLHTAHISHFKVAVHNPIQQPLRWATQHWCDQTLRTEDSKHSSSLFRILQNYSFNYYKPNHCHCIYLLNIECIFFGNHYFS